MLGACSFLTFARIGRQVDQLEVLSLERRACPTGFVSRNSVQANEDAVLQHLGSGPPRTPKAIAAPVIADGGDVAHVVGMIRPNPEYVAVRTIDIDVETRAVGRRTVGADIQVDESEDDVAGRSARLVDLALAEDLVLGRIPLQMEEPCVFAAQRRTRAAGLRNCSIERVQVDCVPGVLVQ